MKPKRFFFRSTQLFGSSLRYGVPVFVGFVVVASGLSAHGGDILRGGVGGSGGGAPPRGSGGGSGGSTPASTDAARSNARDLLARTSGTLAAVRAMQNAARNAAARGPNNLGKSPGKPGVKLPNVPDGLATGGLVATGGNDKPTQWIGARGPNQSESNGKTKVTIKQTDQQALLNWDTFNIGKNTTLTFDQSAGGEDVGKWIAFNRINDPTGNPTQILGSIKADGQVYVINGNGILFGGSSQVNARGLTVSSLPINTNLIGRGLLNNPDVQFLFSGLSVPGGVDGTPNFDPEPPPAGGQYGDIVVQAGAELKSPAESGGNGGRIMLVGPNVTNEGTISTESGQTILAAGLQVGVAAHDGTDPSLRGLDVWVGAIGDYAGTATNSGIIDIATGSAWMTGRHVNQLGVIESSTSVNLNGRIDLKASYGAVANPNFDSTTEQGAGGPLFFNQFTGVVTLGENSVTRILPDYASKSEVPGTALPQRSLINIEGLSVHLDRDSIVLAPNADVSVRAGVWPYKDADGNRTIFGADGVVEAGINSYYSGKTQSFVLSEGQIFLDESSVISVAGSVDVFVPLSHSILDVRLLGPELADSPLQRDTSLRGETLTVDIRNSGIYNGKFWIGTPLGDVMGLAGLIARNAAQLTAVGGNIDLKAGESIVVAKNSTLDVSGGYFSHEGGLVKTTSLISNGRLVPIETATPDQVYDGVFTGESTFTSEKWGVVETTETPLFTGTVEEGYVEGAAGGTLTLTAPGMAIDGELRGLTVAGPRQRSTPPRLSTLRINFEGEKPFDVFGNLQFIKHSPNPPAVVFSKDPVAQSVPVFTLVDDAPAALPSDRTATVDLSTKLFSDWGFGNVEILNPDGSITVPEGISIESVPKGSIAFTGANISILGKVTAPGGRLSFTTFNISPTDAIEFNLLNPGGTAPFPVPVSGRGLFELAESGVLSTSALLVDDSLIGADLSVLRVIDGGSISINTYEADFKSGSVIDVSGGAYITQDKKITYGKGGSISILAGRDPGFPGVIGGSLMLESKLLGHSGVAGGALAIQAGQIQIGGDSRGGTLHLSEDFFRNGGFALYSLTGIGSARQSTSELIEDYDPAIRIAKDSRIVPVVESLIAVPTPDGEGGFELRRFLDSKGIRPPASLSFTALGSDDPFTLDQLEVRGDISMGAGAGIFAEAEASVTFKGGTVTLLGTVSAPGGSISVTGAGAFPLTASQRLQISQALPTVHLGADASLSTAGITQLVPDDFGRRVGTVFDGGRISISGNIVAESGSILDVSGTSGVLDVDPSSLANPATGVTSGLISAPFQQQSVATRIDSNGGLIDLTGSQMLLCDASLRGDAGGKSATGGALSVFSGNFYSEGATRTGADVNLVVTQSGKAITNPGAEIGVGIGLFDSDGLAYGNSGFFAVDRFANGGFASLSLGGKYLASATPIPYGGNIDFRGPIDIDAKGTLRLAAGGVIRADDTVTIDASYISIGQDFRAPEHPDDTFLAFQINPAVISNEHKFAPTFGSGSLKLSANLIDVGTLSLQNIGRANFTAVDGDIRGNGTLGIAGDLVLTASRIYPTTLGRFDIFAYDHVAGTGSVKIRSSGVGGAPISAGGSLSIYSTSIVHEGVLYAPMGTIRLGWDGNDIDLSDADLDSPVDPIAGSTIEVPIAIDVVLAEGSVTSVSGKGLEIPFGISPDGLTWIDPRGINITLSGLPEKSVFVSAENVDMKSGATIDVRGGGRIFATRWVSGNGGSRDLLGTAGAEWGAGTEYQPGSLVTYKGATWSARVRHSGQTPASNLYWSQVAEAFAIVPGFDSKFAPFGAYNTGPNSSSLAGNPGYVSGTLKIGDSITLEAGDGFEAGTYTLLPRGYAQLEEAFLVTPIASTGTGTIQTPEGASIVSGYRASSFNQPSETSQLWSRFEVASAEVVASRVTYAVYSADEFIGVAGSIQLLPQDAGYVAFHGNTSVLLSGSIFTQSEGRGAMVDISSFADMVLISDDADMSADTHAALRTSVLQSWGADSLLVGGVRTTGVDGTAVEVRTGSVTLDNPGEVFSNPEIILASRAELTVTKGSSLASVGRLTGPADILLVTGDGTMLRVSGDADATNIRSGLTGSTQPLMTIGASVGISGPSVILDSTYATDLSPTAVLKADSLTLGSGQISVVFDTDSKPQDGSLIDPHLTLSGVTLAKVQTVTDLTLQSYSNIEFYGAGSLGGDALESITLAGTGISGYRQGSGEVVLRAGNIYFENPSNLEAPSPPATSSGSFRVDAGTIHLGANGFTVSGFRDVSLDATQAVLFEASGSFSCSGDLMVATPFLSGSQAASYSIRSDRNVVLESGGDSPAISGGLGASLTIGGASIAANSDILLPSGSLTLRATDGSLTVGGDLSVSGTSRLFNDLIRYSDAGVISLESKTGDVILSEEGSLSVSAATEGGNGGTLMVSAAEGVFESSGLIQGRGGVGQIGSIQGTSGRFYVDIGSLDALGAASFDSINASLDRGGFTAYRNFRIRNGDVNIDRTIVSHEFLLSADDGGIRVGGIIDASGVTGGSVSLAARGDLTLVGGAKISVIGQQFNSAGKGGSVLLEAGTQSGGISNVNALLDLQAGSEIFLGVDDYVEGTYTEPGSSAFEGKFSGTLHLRAPRTAANNDVRIDSIESLILGASSVVVEGYKLYAPAGGVLNIAQRNLIHSESIGFLGAAGVLSGNESAMRSKLLNGAVDAAGLGSLLVISPGVEMINLTGDLTLGLANTIFGSLSPEAQATADWDLSGFRYGSRSAPGVLTLRAGGNLVFNNALSDGFTPIAVGTPQQFLDNGHSQMWLGKLMPISDLLPVNTQSWSYRLTAGADLDASNFRDVVPLGELDSTQPAKGSVIVGEFYQAVPNTLSTGLGAAIGPLGQTADSIRISTINRGTRFEVVRTGTGDITISAGRDVQLRNQFATIYTAGVALPTSTTVYNPNDFFLPVLPTTVNSHPSQSGGVGVTLGEIQQLTQAAWSMAGGNVSLAAQADIGRYTLISGVITVDSSRQMPTNWLYRRGYVDSTTGLFASDGGFGSSPGVQNSENIHDVATSTAWWIDYSNFFQGIGALGGGNVTLEAGRDIVNVDAVAPTNARMPGRKANPDFIPGSTTEPEFLNLAPDAGKLVELGGGDVIVKAGRNIDGGIYYVEKGVGSLFAGGSITTNQARTPSLGILSEAAPFDPLTWMPTTLFVGKSHFNVTARGDVLLGPVSNPFLLPQGVNNKYWYKTYFTTYSADAGASVSSYGGDVTHRMSVTLPDGASPRSVLDIWFNVQNLFTGENSAFSASNFQPWLRLAELDLTTFENVFRLVAPNLSSTSFGGSLNLTGNMTLYPSATGDLEMAASGGIIGLQDSGPGFLNGNQVKVWTASSISVSDASPDLLPGFVTPLAYQTVVGQSKEGAVQGRVDILKNVSLAINETGSSSGLAASSAVKQALHASDLLHLGDSNPVRIYAVGGDITGLTLFSPKVTRIVAQQDITDVSFYLQNVSLADVTLVSAGRDIIPFNENAAVRTIANNLSLGNAMGDVRRSTSSGDATNALAGDIQINGPGVLEVLSGRNLDLGVGANFTDGTGVGITSIGNVRNPYLPFGGADVIVLSGVSSATGQGPALGLAQSSMDVAGFIERYELAEGDISDSAYLKKIRWKGKFTELAPEQQAIVALEEYYRILRDAGRDAPEEGNYDRGYEAVSKLFGKKGPAGEILTRAREIRTTSGGAISLGSPGGGITMASAIFGNPLTPPGIVTEYGGAISTFTKGDVGIGQARIFTLRGGDIIMWSSKGDIAAGTSPKTVVTAPPTRVVININSADVQTDLGGLATGGGIGVLASVEGVKAGNVDLVAPKGIVDAGDAGIRVTGNLNIAAQVVLNSSNISAGGTSTGATPASVSAPSVTAITSASNSSTAAGNTVAKPGPTQEAGEQRVVDETLSIITVEVIGYGGGSEEEEEKDKQP